MNFFFQRLTLGLFVFLMGGSASFSKDVSPAEEAYLYFETICLSHLESPEEIPSRLETIGAKELPEEIAEKVLAPQTGRAWFVKSDANRIILSLTKQNVCTLSAEDYGREIKDTFLKHASHQFLDKEDVGSQLQEAYKIDFQDQKTLKNITAVSLITTSKIDNLNGIFLNVMPFEMFKKIGE